jgi:hypothetical protein
MATITVSYKGDTDLSQVFIDDVRVLVGNGTASHQVPDGGQDHALTWFVRGAPGSKYELKITAPAAAKFDHKATIDSSTKDAGLHWFRVG